MKINGLKKICLLSLSAFFLGACGGGGNGDGGGNPAPNPLFQAAVTYLTGKDPQAIAYGNFDGDKDINNEDIMDIAVVNEIDDSISIFFGNGDGTFTTTPVTVDLAPGSCPVAIASGNFFDDKGDNIDDLAVVNFSTDNIAIIIGNSDRNSIKAETDTYPVGVSPQGIAVGDFNGQFGDDIAVANSADNNNFGSVSILLGDAVGTFAPQNKIGPANFNGPFAITAGDFNSNDDTILDLSIVNQAGESVTTHLGSQTVPAGFIAAPESSISVGKSPSAIASGDFNNDGKLDIVVANTKDSPDPTVSILLGDGTGNFLSPTTEFTGGDPFSVATGDLDQDGNFDIAVANQADDSVSILLGRGDGTFEPQKTFQTGDVPSSVILSDFNKDGKLDMAVANSGSDTVSVFLNAL